MQYYSLKASMEQSFLLVTRDEQASEYGSGNGLLSRGFLISLDTEKRQSIEFGKKNWA